VGAGGGSGACEPGEIATCYSGSSGTDGVGECKSGSRTCDAEGQAFGPCEGEVIPAEETCGQPSDQDCDGALCGDTFWGALYGDVTDEAALSVAADAQGNVVVVGSFSGSIIFGSDVLISAGMGDVFVLKMSSSGASAPERSTSVEAIFPVAFSSPSSIAQADTFGARGSAVLA